MNPEESKHFIGHSTGLEGPKGKEEEKEDHKLPLNISKLAKKNLVYPSTHGNPNDKVKKSLGSICSSITKQDLSLKGKLLLEQNGGTIKKAHLPGLCQKKDSQGEREKLKQFYNMLKEEGKGEIVNPFDHKPDNEDKENPNTQSQPNHMGEVQMIEEKAQEENQQTNSLEHSQNSKGKDEENIVGSNPEHDQNQKEGLLHEQKDDQEISISKKKNTQNNQEKSESVGYNFYNVNDEPNSLVMLKRIQHVLPLLVITPVFLLFKCPAQTKKKVEDKSLSYIVFDDIGEMKEHIQSQLVGKHIQVLSPAKNAKEIGDKLSQCSKIENFQLYFEEEELTENQKLGISPHSALTRLLDLNRHPQRQKILQKHQFYDLKNALNHWEDIAKCQYVKMQLPNIVHLNEDGWKAGIQLRTMFAMLSQENTNQEKIMDELYKLSASIYSTQKKSFKEYQSIDEVIRTYTEPISPQNIITNNLLRASRNPSQIFYCQPYFRQLFKAIESLYKKQKLSSGTYYRGASASTMEINSYKKNVGQIIQNLGFLSTATEKAVGQMFARNLMFVITVKDELRDPDLDYGYADIHRYSHYRGQKEILFNPLNTFTIDKVEATIKKSVSSLHDDQPIDVVYLTYGSLARIRYREKQGQELDQLEERYAAQAEYLVQGLKNRMKNQGCAFLSQTSTSDYISGGLQYWQQQLKHVHDQRRKAEILHRMGSAYDFKGEYEKALMIYEECRAIEEATQGKNHSDYVTALNNIGGVYDEMGRYKQALTIYEECRGIEEQTLGRSHSSYAMTLNNIAGAYKQLGRYQEALKMYDECKEIQGETLGQSHPDYAKTLNNIGGVYYEMGRYQQALLAYEECREVEGATLGKNHPDYATTLGNIGGVYDEMGKYQQALKMYEECRVIEEVTLGKGHPDYMITLKNMKVAYKKMGKFQQAHKIDLQLSQ